MGELPANHSLPLTPAPRPAPAGEPPPHASGRFNPNFSFDQFVVGNGNRLAHAGALAVAEGATSYNPLFLHGGVGVGKTHLLQAIGGRCVNRGRQALYITSETFTNELIAAIRAGDASQFRRRYREIEVLLVDDIHFIVGKESTQEEFFHTFNWLYDNGKQVVLSSDKPPGKMRVLDERLRSRFCWGLLADMEPPDVETRVEILRRKVLQRGRWLPEDVLAFLAGQTRQNVRELEGLLNKLLALSDLHGFEPTLALAAGLSSDGDRHHEVGAEEILDTVAAYYRLKVSSLTGQQRSRNISTPRHVAMYLMREDARLSLPQIGDILGGRDHSTVIYGCNRITRELQDDTRMHRDIDAIRSMMFSESRRVGISLVGGLGVF